MEKSTKLTPPEQDEILKEIGISLTRNSPPTWHKIVFSVSALQSQFRIKTVVVHGNNEEEAIETPNDVALNITKLRDGMYKQEKGTWISAVYKVERPGTFSIDYNYDEEPSFGEPEPTNEEWAADVERYPRSPDSIPEWLRQKVESATLEGEQ